MTWFRHRAARPDQAAVVEELTLRTHRVAAQLQSALEMLEKTAKDDDYTDEAGTGTGKPTEGQESR